MIREKTGVRREASEPADAITAPSSLPEPRLLSLKVIYFFFFAGQGAFFSFINVYYASIGLSGTQIGLINMVAPLVGMFSGPLWGMLSDRLGRTRRLLMIAVSGVIVSTLLLSGAQSFVTLLPIVALYAVFNSTVMPLVDSTTLSMLGEHRERYGRQRVWGTIGFIVTSAFIGSVLERVGLHGIFPAYLVAIICLLVSLIWLPERPVKLSGSMLRGVSAMMRQPPWLLFAGSLVLLGLATSGMSNFLSVMVKQMGGSDSMIGIMWTAAALAEMPIMASSAFLLGRFGARRLIAVALFAYAVRMLLYGLMPAPEWSPIVNLLGGVSFGLYWISAVNYANELAPEHLKATSQGLLLAITSLAAVVGALFTGWLFDLVGPALMFRLLSVCCVLALILFGVGRVLMSRRQLA